MKRVLIIGGLALLVLMGVVAAGWIVPDAKWSGVDESVVAKFAEQAGRPPAEPYLNTEQGDLKLFFFLIAGALGGFIAGYQWCQLFRSQEAHGLSGHGNPGFPQKCGGVGRGPTSPRVSEGLGPRLRGGEGKTGSQEVRRLLRPLRLCGETVVLAPARN